MTNISFSRQRYLAKIDLLLSGIYNVFAFSFKGFIIWFGRVLVSLTFTSMKLRWLFTFNISIFIDLQSFSYLETF